MKYPGQPKSPPAWYMDRGSSYIENQFSKNLNDLADAIEAEHWFGDSEKHARYRVDFLLKDARLIIELDGNQYHSTKEQLEKDAIRQRYLTRAGYSVIRFTGSEIVRNIQKCVSEVRVIYKERIKLSPSKYRAIYLDYPFVRQEINNYLEFYKGLYPEKSLEKASSAKLIPEAMKWLQEKSFITAFIFHPPKDLGELRSLDGKSQEYEKGEIKINLIQSEMYVYELSEHLTSFSHLFDEFYLVADDPAYIDPMSSVLNKDMTEKKPDSLTNKYLANGKLLRKGNHETSFSGTELARVKWQDISYAIGSAMGLNFYEL